MSITRHDLFVESMFTVQPPEVDNDAIFDFFKLAKKNHNGVKRSNVGGWQFDMNPGMCPEYDDVMDKLTYAANHILCDVYKMKTRVRISNSWLNYSARGGLNSVHTHPGALLSGVYYIKTSPETGPINFMRDNNHSIETTMWWSGDQDYAKNPERDKAWLTHVHKKPKIGSAYIFSSWLQHEVIETTVDEDRLVAGINFVPANDDF